MSLMISIDLNPDFAPVESAPLPERLIDGELSSKTWLQDAAMEGRVQTGVFEASPGAARSIKGEMFEFCTILSGCVEITPDGGQPVLYRTGESYVLKPGFTGIWRAVKTSRKLYVSVKS